MRVLVCDDVQSRCDEIANEIVKAGQPKPDVLAAEKLSAELTTLFEDIRSCLENPEKFGGVRKTAFDDADVVIVDNNLGHLQVPGARLTAESISGYVRAFTTATYVVSLNLNPDVDFDLRFLVGDFSTRADLALNANHLANPGLWTGDQKSVKDGFLPWYWPKLSGVADRRLQQIDFVRKHLDEVLVKALGFDDEAISFLSPHARGALSPEVVSDAQNADGWKPFSELTFRDVFIAKDRSIPIKPERVKLSDAERNGRAELREIISRVVAADMDLWFRRDIVAPQEPLVDVPHLLVRFPFLLGDRAKDIGGWNAAVQAKAAPYGIEQNSYDASLGKTKFEHEIWVRDACFWWPKLKADEKLNALLFEGKEGDWADVVFCEDRSAFIERAPKAGEPPTEFPAEFEGTWERRYVARVSGYRYSPRSRLAI
jgi:hypothetical protein